MNTLVIKDTHVDNFELIGDMLNFDAPNSFYQIQILKRKKENPDLKVNARTINIYYVYSKEDFHGLKERIVYDCLHNNARAYINLNRLDSYMVALNTQKIINKLIIDGQFDSVKNAYAHACGNFRSEEEDENDRVFKIKKILGDVDDKIINSLIKELGLREDINSSIIDKLWLIDIDIIENGEIDESQIELSNNIIKTITELHKDNSNKKNYKIIGKIPTKNGHHIITNPFNQTKFNAIFPGVTYYTNSPTILYI